jgi:hypothetical protein
MRVLTSLLDLIASALLRTTLTTSCTCCHWANALHWRSETLRRLDQRWRE